MWYQFINTCHAVAILLLTDDMKTQWINENAIKNCVEINKMSSYKIHKSQ